MNNLSITFTLTTAFLHSFYFFRYFNITSKFIHFHPLLTTSLNFHHHSLFCHYFFYFLHFPLYPPLFSISPFLLFIISIIFLHIHHCSPFPVSFCFLHPPFSTSSSKSDSVVLSGVKSFSLLLLLFFPPFFIFFFFREPFFSPSTSFKKYTLICNMRLLELDF